MHFSECCRFASVLALTWSINPDIYTLQLKVVVIMVYVHSIGIVVSNEYIGITLSVQSNLTLAFELKEMELSYYTRVPCDKTFLYIPEIFTP